MKEIRKVLKIYGVGFRFDVESVVYVSDGHSDNLHLHLSLEGESNTDQLKEYGES